MTSAKSLVRVRDLCFGASSDALQGLGGGRLGPEPVTDDALILEARSKTHEKLE
jgi:hypothetical protein